MNRRGFLKATTLGGLVCIVPSCASVSKAKESVLHKAERFRAEAEKRHPSLNISISAIDYPDYCELVIVATSPSGQTYILDEYYQELKKHPIKKMSKFYNVIDSGRS